MFDGTSLTLIADVDQVSIYSMFVFSFKHNMRSFVNSLVKCIWRPTALFYRRTNPLIHYGYQPLGNFDHCILIVEILRFGGK